MPATRQRQRRRAAASGEPVWVIDLVAAEAQRAMVPVAQSVKQRWLPWLGFAAATVWVYDVVSLLVQVRH